VRTQEAREREKQQLQAELDRQEQDNLRSIAEANLPGFRAAAGEKLDAQEIIKVWAASCLMGRHQAHRSSTTVPPFLVMSSMDHTRAAVGSNSCDDSCAPQAVVKGATACSVTFVFVRFDRVERFLFFLRRTDRFVSVQGALEEKVKERQEFERKLVRTAKLMDHLERARYDALSALSSHTACLYMSHLLSAAPSVAIQGALL
jgi:hypothetical protein